MTTKRQKLIFYFKYIMYTIPWYPALKYVQVVNVITKCIINSLGQLYKIYLTILTLSTFASFMKQNYKFRYISNMYVQHLCVYDFTVYRKCAWWKIVNAFSTEE